MNRTATMIIGAFFEYFAPFAIPVIMWYICKAAYKKMAGQAE